MTTRRPVTFHDIIYAPVANANGRLLPVLILADGTMSRLAVEWMLSPDFAGRASKTLSEAMAAVGLLCDYYYAALNPLEPRHQPLATSLVQFGNALLSGTINENGDCPFGLYWRGRPDRAERLAKHAERFCKFCAAQIDPTAYSVTETAFLVNVRKSWTGLSSSGGLLSHLRESRRHLSANSKGTSSAQPVGEGRVTPFPSDSIARLLAEGCKRERALSDPSVPQFVRSYNVRNMLAFLLLLGGGLRTEELFHIFANDVYARDDAIARVNLYHPVRGAITWSPVGSGRRITTNRDRFLRDRYGLIPRSLYHDKHPLWAGWKGLLLTHGAPQYYTEVFWIYPQLGRLFWYLHRYYITYMRSRSAAKHPYYFMSLNRSNYGDPWTLSSFQDAWQKAIVRIGLTQNKLSGTNPHAARHWYGQTAANLGIDPRIRQIMMHHRNILSQLRYQKATPEQVNTQIDLAHERMARSLHQRIQLDGTDAVMASYKHDDCGKYLEALLATNASGNPPQSPYDFGHDFEIDPMGLLSSWDLFTGGGTVGN